MRQIFLQCFSADFEKSVCGYLCRAGLELYQNKYSTTNVMMRIFRKVTSLNTAVNQRPKMEVSAKIVDSFQSLTIITPTFNSTLLTLHHQLHLVNTPRYTVINHHKTTLDV